MGQLKITKSTPELVNKGGAQGTCEDPAGPKMFQDVKWGVTNPLGSSANTPVFSNSSTTNQQALSRVAREIYSPNIISEATTFPGVVMRSEETKNSPRKPFLKRLFSLWKKRVGDLDMEYVYKVYMPHLECRGRPEDKDSPRVDDYLDVFASAVAVGPNNDSGKQTTLQQIPDETPVLVTFYDLEELSMPLIVEVVGQPPTLGFFSGFGDAFGSGAGSGPAGSSRDQFRGGAGGGGNCSDAPTSAATTSTEAPSGGSFKVTDSLIGDIVWDVIAARGRSKAYVANSKGLFYDSHHDTAVGVLHYTKSGLKALYDAMGKAKVVGKYFGGKTRADLVAFIKTANGQELDYAWWKSGMTNFLNSSDSKPVQDAAAIKKFRAGLRRYPKYPVRRPRDMAIFMSLYNSKPRYIRDFGRETNWNPDEMMRKYCDHKLRTRCKMVAKYYPGAGADTPPAVVCTEGGSPGNSGGPSAPVEREAYTPSSSGGNANGKKATYTGVAGGPMEVRNASLPPELLETVRFNGDEFVALRDMVPDLLALKAKYEEVFRGQGHDLFRVNNAYRDYAWQSRLYNDNCSGGTCSPPTASPGRSRHGWGAAVDLGSRKMFGSSTSSLKFRWLNKYGQQFNFVFSVSSEAWHLNWSPVNTVLAGAGQPTGPWTSKGLDSGPADLRIASINNPGGSTV